MATTLSQLQAWLQGKENEHLEFKEAKQNFHFEKLVEYCCALANEGGGKIILGVTDKPPRKVVGTHALSTLERTKAGLVERLRLRIDAEEITHPDGRIVVFHVPSRPLGVPVSYKGCYYMRAGEDLVPMTPDMLKRIFDETGPDFSAEVCDEAALDDLDANAIERFRGLWQKKSGNTSLANLPVAQLLADAELVFEGRVTYAALILLGTKSALGKHLAQAEVVFEYRSSEAAGPPQERADYRDGFLNFADDLWDRINLRNDVQHFQEGLFITDVRTFDEGVVREALLNAVAHRDYRLAGSVFVRQFARRLEIVSPGGFLPGVTAENLLWKQAPRNRRLSEALARCGLVERSGQGINRMYEQSIRQSKPIPDFSRSDDHEVGVTIRGDIQDVKFLQFLEKVGSDQVGQFGTDDLLLLDHINREQPIPDRLKARLQPLVDLGVVERKGRGRGTKYLLSRRFYSYLGKPGAYTRRKGLDHETQKELLMKHITDNADKGCQLGELAQVLPQRSKKQIQSLLAELKKEQRIALVGRTRGARWYPADQLPESEG